MRVAPRIIGRPGGFGVAPRRYSQPYYSFRPRVSVGFGLWIGYPISYPSYYAYDPYAYSYPYAAGSYPYPADSYGYPADSYPYPSTSYPYPSTSYPSYGSPQSGYPSSQSGYPAPPPGSIQVQPGQAQAQSGGLSFEISPNTAELYVDGSYVGTTGDFTPSTDPLDLAPGRHHVEIRAPGYRTVEFDADVIAGQVIPYQGTMER